MNDNDYFPTSYFASRERFRASLTSIQNQWPGAQLFNHVVESDEDLTIDWIEASASQIPEALLVVTCGEHGAEAFAGCAVLQMIIEEYLPNIDPLRVGLALVHTINPWGMAHHRRTNKANVDLNRNFVTDPMRLDPAFNPDYARLNWFLNPSGKLRIYQFFKQTFLPYAVLVSLLTGVKRLRNATLLGQYRFPKGIYYGGRSIQPETQVMMALYRRWFGAYQRVVHIDLHTGYGPRYQMSIVNSAFEATPSKEHARQFKYPLVVKSDPQEFYSISGDMIDYVYQMMRAEFQGKPFYSTTFEFGTAGDGLPQVIGALRCMLHENQMFHHGTTNEMDKTAVRKDFNELYCPGESTWRNTALVNARQALNGILSVWGILPVK